MLDAFADASRLWSLFGRRLIVLVQVDDPSYVGPPDLGARPAQWNGREWMTNDRYDPSELSQADGRRRTETAFSRTLARVKTTVRRSREGHAP